jgi:hypothetical protein
MTVPSINLGDFKHRPYTRSTAPMPDEQFALAGFDDLDQAGSRWRRHRSYKVRRRILDRDGSQHGCAPRLICIVQNPGHDESALYIYDEGLRKKKRC